MRDAVAGCARGHGAGGIRPQTGGEAGSEDEWGLPAGLGLHFRQLGNRVAVFNEETADTHLLEPWAAALLERLHQGPATLGTLQEAVQPEPGGGASDVAGALEEFRYLGLIEPVPRCS